MWLGFWLLPALAVGISPAKAANSSLSAQLDFNAAPSQIRTRCALARDEALKRLDLIAEIPDSERNFSNTPEAIENILDDLNDKTSAYAFLENVAVSSATRQAARDCRELVKDFGAYTDDEENSQIFSREDLFKAVEAYAGLGKALSPARKRLLDQELMDFKRNGLKVPLEPRAILSAVRERIARSQESFAQNIDAPAAYLLVSSNELSGLPADFVSRLPRLDGRYKIGLDAWDYDVFMENDQDPDARRRLEFLFDNRAAAQNVDILAKTLTLRWEAARFLGYPDDASYRLAGLGDGDLQQAEKFLDSLQKKLIPQARGELAQLARLKAAQEGRSDGTIRAWDWRYYDREMKAANVDPTRFYFSLPQVLKTLFAVNETLLGVKFQRVPDAAAWASGVELYQILDDGGRGQELGDFYLDLFSRPGKLAGLSAFSIIAGRELPDGSYQKPVAALTADFHAPHPEGPALLSYGEDGQVQALFSEFGRVMALVMARASYERFSSNGTGQDFAPVQARMMEDFAWRPEIAALMAGTGDSQNSQAEAAAEELQKFLRTHQSDGALKALRRVFLARLDMRYHGDPLAAGPTAICQDLMSEISLIPMTPGTNPEAALSRLMDARGAGYYEDLWSEIYAQDMMSRFAQDGALNPAIGWLYRKEMLESGTSRDQVDSLKAFLGRAPDERAFLQDLGISS